MKRLIFSLFNPHYLKMISKPTIIHLNSNVALSIIGETPNFASTNHVDVTYCYILIMHAFRDILIAHISKIH